MTPNPVGPVALPKVREEASDSPDVVCVSFQFLRAIVRAAGTQTEVAEIVLRGIAEKLESRHDLTS